MTGINLSQRLFTQIFAVFVVILCPVFGRSSESSRIEAFAIQARSSSAEFISTNAIYRLDEVRLLCVVSTPSSQEFNIKAPDNETILPARNEAHLIIHDAGKIKCDKIGTYKCEGPRGAYEKADLGVLRCDPMLCPSEKDPEKTIIAAVNETKTVSVCVKAFPDIYSIHAHKSSLYNWSSSIEMTAFSRYEVKITFTVRSSADYGRHKFSIFTSQKGGYKMDYTFKLSEPGIADKLSSTGNSGCQCCYPSYLVFTALILTASSMI